MGGAIMREHYHKEQPIRHFPVLARVGRKADLEIFIVGCAEVLHYTAGLEEADGLTVGEGVCHCGDFLLGIGKSVTAGMGLRWHLWCGM